MGRARDGHGRQQAVLSTKSADPFALGREASALAVIQPKSSPSDLLLEDPVLLDEVLGPSSTCVVNLG